MPAPIPMHAEGVSATNYHIRPAWWKESTVYQIYPASFKDDSGDGLGDIAGIISKLDYIKNLGVDIVWLSPVLQSPQVDMGYDISDYRDIHAPYGTMTDHDDLIKGLHERGLKYVMDLVVNHTSDQHEWFKEARLGKNSPKRDWYIWRKARIDRQTGARSPPNNWESAFSGSAWSWDETTKEYYLHLFAPQQPDLNWENPDVVAAVHALLRFWLDRGVDGFRMDVINLISKAPGLPDATPRRPGFIQNGAEHFTCGPRLHEFLQGIGKIMIEYEAFSVGEMPGIDDQQELLRAVGQDRGELAMAFQFDIVEMDSGPGNKWLPRQFHVHALKNVVEKWQTFLPSNGGWNALFLENHDQSRSISRYASEAAEYRSLSGKMLATHLALLCGTVFIYQGQELAQINIPKEWPIEKYHDIECLNHWKTTLRDHPHDRELQERTLKQYRLMARDNARTPMQWSSKANAGFTSDGCKVAPWMDVHPDYVDWNAENQVDDPNSCYSYWRRLLELRRTRQDLFVYGRFEIVHTEGQCEDVVAYTRKADEGSEVALVVTSFREGQVEWRVPERWEVGATVVLGNYEERGDGEGRRRVNGGKVVLREYEALVLLSS